MDCCLLFYISVVKMEWRTWYKLFFPNWLSILFCYYIKTQCYSIKSVFCFLWGKISLCETIAFPQNLTCFLFICIECTIYPQSRELRRFCQPQSFIIWGDRALLVTHLRNIKGSVGSWIYCNHAVFDIGSLVLSCWAWICSQIDVSFLTNRQQYSIS